MYNIRNLLLIISFMLSTCALADDMDEFLQALGKKDWDTCLRLAEKINPNEELTFDSDESTEQWTTAIFGVLNFLREDKNDDLIRRIQLLHALLPKINQDAPIDSRSEDTAFEYFVEEVSLRKIDDLVWTELQELCLAFL